MYPVVTVGETVYADDLGFGMVLDNYRDGTILVKWEDVSNPQIVDVDTIEQTDAPDFWGTHPFDPDAVALWF